MRVQNPNGKIRAFSGTERRSGVRKAEEVDQIQESLLRSKVSQAAKTVRFSHGDRTLSPASTIPLSPAKSARKAKSETSAASQAGEAEHGQQDLHTAGGQQQAGGKKEASARKQKQHGSGAAFPIRKDTLAKHKEVAAVLQGEKLTSLQKQLSKGMEELEKRGGDGTDCPHDSQGLLTSISTTASNLVGLQEKVATCNAGNIEIYEKQIETIENCVNEIATKVGRAFGCNLLQG